jgi:hypothetical protein
VFSSDATSRLYLVFHVADNIKIITIIGDDIFVFQVFFFVTGDCNKSSLNPMAVNVQNQFSKATGLSIKPSNFLLETFSSENAEFSLYIS